MDGNDLKHKLLHSYLTEEVNEQAISQASENLNIQEKEGEKK
jgi:hypothetical protein